MDCLSPGLDRRSLRPNQGDGYGQVKERLVPTPTQLTRQELYELVWSEPMRTLAKRYGISDVGLAKACRRHRIPRPHRGYWQQKEHGKPGTPGGAPAAQGG